MELIAIQLETDHDNPNACSFYAYFKGEFDASVVEAAFEDDEDERVSGGLSPFYDDDGIQGFDVPSPLSRATGLRRFFVAQGC